VPGVWPLNARRSAKTFKKIVDVFEDARIASMEGLEISATASLRQIIRSLERTVKLVLWPRNRLKF
jgi:hypothetical protein